VKDLRAVDEHGGRGFAGIKPALPDVGDDLGLHTARLAYQVGQAAEQLVVGDRLERALVFHALTIDRGHARMGPEGTEESN
jgi:hypothetical protein